VLAVLALRQALLPMRSPGMPALCKALNYRALFIEEITVTATGTVVSVTLAFLTHSVWSIVFGAIAGALSSVIVSYILSRSARARSGTARRPTRLATWAARSSSTPWSWRSGSTPTGSLASASCRWWQMGLYAVAWNLAAVIDTLVTRRCDVYFSMLSRRGDHDSQAAWHKKTCARITRFALPGGFAVVALSPLVIRACTTCATGPRDCCSPCSSRASWCAGSGQVQFQFLLARAEVHLATRAYFVAMLVQFSLFLLLVPRLGAIGMALSAFASASALTFIQTWLLARRTGWAWPASPPPSTAPPNWPPPGRPGPKVRPGSCAGRRRPGGTGRASGRGGDCPAARAALGSSASQGDRAAQRAAERVHRDVPQGGDLNTERQGIDGL